MKKARLITPDGVSYLGKIISGHKIKRDKNKILLVFEIEKELGAT